MSQEINKEISFGNINIVSTAEVIKIRDTEQSIINWMILSFDNYKYIKEHLTFKDFTFKTHSIIFEYINRSEDKFLEMIDSNKFNNALLSAFIERSAYVLGSKNIVKEESVLNILSKAPSINIDEDINFILFYAMEKKYAIENKKSENHIALFTFDDLISRSTAKFIDNRLVEVETSYIESIPSELCDTAIATFESLMEQINLQNSDIEVNISDDVINSIPHIYFEIKKDIKIKKDKEQKEQEAFRTLYKWADKYNLSKEEFPREPFDLLALKILVLDHKKIKEIPKELVLLKKLEYIDLSFNKITSLPEEFTELKRLKFLVLKGNNITSLPKDIDKLNQLIYLCFCMNAIKEIPNKLYKLNQLANLCMHDNKLTFISEDINKLNKLRKVSFSNNYIQTLPNTIDTLKNLERLEFENNHIKKIDFHILKLSKLNHIAFDDELLEPILENKDSVLNVNTINLSESKLNKDSEFIKNLSFEIQDTQWVEKEDKRENGCVFLSN
ncbi:leucine-rich repeat domain-containing protein [Poseidonibacter antarcticus]|uniref:leucine-rich repeat domain-containing protein n=1 Tax=Poseidonibacter antarcticus TaxID=2478538 RepID=UPI000EF53FBD|nr:leucine-rich repeat domain-containing protein [Poseidonibacter antarcticus]